MSLMMQNEHIKNTYHRNLSSHIMLPSERFLSLDAATKVLFWQIWSQIALFTEHIGKGSSPLAFITLSRGVAALDAENEVSLGRFR